MLSIEYINCPDKLRRLHGDPFNRVFLDVDAAFEARLTKALDEVDERDQVSQEASLSGDLPATNRNRALLDQFRGDVVNRNTRTILVEVIQDGDRLPLTGAAVLGMDEGEKSYTFELFGDAWLDQLENTVLADVDIGTFEYTTANVISTWGNRQTLALPGLAHYGAWNTPGNVTLEDFRFWFNLGKLMREVFCHIGWSFESPHYDEGEGAYLFSYLPNEDEFWYDGKQSPRYVSTEVSTPQAFTGGRVINTLQLDDVYDPDDLYNNPSWPYSYKYQTPTGSDKEVSIRIEFENLIVQLPPSPDGEPAYVFTLSVFKRRAVGGGIYSNMQMHQERHIGSSEETRTLEINLSVLDENAISGDEYRIQTNYLNLNQGGDLGQNYTILSGNVYFKPNPSVFYEGDIIPLNNLLPSTITGKDLFLAMAQLINGKIYTDNATKKVYLYQPFDYFMQDGETIIEGFFITGKPLDLRANTVKNQTGWENKDQTRKRFRDYAFADIQDAYLDSDAPYTRRVDLGTGVNEVEESKNPLFEPTGEIRAAAAEVGGSGVYMPVLWDNEDGELSEELGPRIANYYGLVGQSGLTWAFNGVTEILIPYLSQIPTIALPDTVDFIALTFTGFGRDLYNMYYKREVERCRNGIGYRLLITGGDQIYKKIDFRHTILISDRDSDLEMQPTSVKDHPAGSRIPLLVEARMI